MPKLTSYFINTKITPADIGKTAFYRDDEVTGFALNVTDSSMTYVAECRVNGATRILVALKTRGKMALKINSAADTCCGETDANSDAA